ncbi:Gp138 family membrane-puncturing spike protein [Roseixanthobacter pseudopolyaromaticivorans]|uniref:Gp138 family membrane-puncturing spike protein n=1 Tax=Xanthobacteraceae TaxID=335928 RepID=UPI00372C03E1
MDQRTRFDVDLDEAIQTAIDGRMAELHTAVPVKIVSVDYQKQTCVVQPTVKACVRKPDGSQEWISLPQIQDAPLHFPRGGGVSMTFPVAVGDEGLAIISSRSQDAWQQSGGEQQQIDNRGHDLSNAFVMVGFRSNPNALANVPSDSVQIRSADGNTLIDIKGGQVKVKATGAESTVTPDKITHKVGGLSVEITSDRIDLGGAGGSPVMTEGGPSTKVFARVV